MNDQFFDPATDPLGIALKERARKHREQWKADDARKYQDLQRDSFGTGLGLFGPSRMPGGSSWLGGPASDPAWDGFFQAMAEAGVDRVGDSSVGADKGWWSPPAEASPGFDPRFQTSASSTAADVINKEGGHIGYDIQPKRRKTQHIGGGMSPAFKGFQSDESLSSPINGLKKAY